MQAWRDCEFGIREKVDTVNRYILLADDFGSLEIGPILKNDFIKKMKAWGII